MHSALHCRLIAVIAALVFPAFLVGCHSDTKAKSVPELVKKLKDPDAAVRAQAVEDLRLLRVEKSKSAIPEIAEMFGDEDEKCRRWAAECLGTFGEDAYPVVMQKAKDKNPKVRAASWKALTGLGVTPLNHKEEFTKALGEALHDEDLTVRQNAAGNFMNNSSSIPDVVPAVLTALEKNDDRKVVCGLAMGMQNLKTEYKLQMASALPRLRVLSESSDEMIKNTAKKTLDSVEKAVKP